jgi:uncharacterized coiled-coil protein SlyX
MGEANGERSSAGERESWIPRPDPSLLTTEQLHHEVAALRQILETRLDGMDIATKVLNDTVTRVPTDVDRQVAHLRELHEEKFKSVDKQFAERDIRAERESRDNKIAVDAAFAAAKEAVAAQNVSSSEAISKSEASTTKQIDAIGAQVVSSQKATDDKINDIKETLAQRTGRGAGITAAVGLGMSLIVAIAIVASVVIAVFHK